MIKESPRKPKNLTENWLTQGNLAVVYVFIGFLSENLLQMVIVPFLHKYSKYVLKDCDVYSFNINMSAGNTTTFNLHSIPKNRTKLLESKDVIVEIALLFASKSIAEVIALPILGTLADRIDYKVSFLIGVFLVFLSAVTFPFGTSYKELILSRITHGIGAGLISIAGYGIIVEIFKDPITRTNAVAIVTYAVYFGLFIGAPLGGFLYHFGGDFLPFIILASLLFFTFILVLSFNRKLCCQCFRNTENRNVTPIYKFFIDLHIMIPLGALFVSNLPFAFLNPVLSTWMSETTGASEWQIGMIWIPTFFANTSGTYVGSKLAKAFPRYFWLIALSGLMIIAVSTIFIPFIRSIYLEMVPMATLWFGVCLIDTSVIPYLGCIADTRYNSVYGSTFSLMALAFALASALSGMLAGDIMKQCGFMFLNLLTASCNLIYIPLLMFIRKGVDQPINEATPLNKPIKDVVTGKN